ncbi:MAG: OmpA family protein [Bacteroidaceae bacterium]|nr:OmpA family protein [Prevotellaceae bacterium]MDY3062588.1 OmpA family protein [Bacteroidaceae bacterium]
MKKFFMLLAVCATVSFATAQTTVRGSKFTDNWSVGLQAGGLTPLTHHSFIGDLRPIVGITIAKELTPVFGLAIEGNTLINGGHNTRFHSSNAFDASNISGLMSFNLTNLIWGYKGEPRLVDVKAVYGFGWGHEYYPGEYNDVNLLTSKAGLNIGFNVGADKAWQINVKPAIVWALGDGGYTQVGQSYNANLARFEIAAGVTYKFKNSNGTHNFVLVKEYDQAEVDGLNAKINDLRNQLGAKDQKIAADAAAIKKLQDELNDCRNKKKPAAVEAKAVNTYETNVFFACGKSVISKAQVPNVARVASFLKNNPGARVSVKGYASPEGPAALNQKLSVARAEAVKKMLVKKYKIEASRIEAQGCGVGDVFSEPTWNRVAISTITK